MAIVIVMLALWGNPIKQFLGTVSKKSSNKILILVFLISSLLTEFQTI